MHFTLGLFVKLCQPADNHSGLTKPESSQNALPQVLTLVPPGCLPDELRRPLLEWRQCLCRLSHACLKAFRHGVKAVCCEVLKAATRKDSLCPYRC